jgi:hypothetical protein
VVLKFTSKGKPVKAIQQPASLEEAMTPVTPGQTGTVTITPDEVSPTDFTTYTEKELAGFLFSKIDEMKKQVFKEGPLVDMTTKLDVKAEVDAAASGTPIVDMSAVPKGMIKKPKAKAKDPNHLANSIVHIDVPATVAPQPSWPLDNLIDPTTDKMSLLIGKTPAEMSKLIAESVKVGADKLAGFSPAMTYTISQKDLPQLDMNDPEVQKLMATVAEQMQESVKNLLIYGTSVPNEMLGGEVTTMTGMDGTQVQSFKHTPHDDFMDAALQTIVQKPKSDVVTEEASSEVLTLVDRYTEIQAEIEKHDMAPLLAEQETIKKQLQSIAKADHFPSGKPVQLNGTHANYVRFSPQTNSTKIVDKEGLVEKIGVSQWVDNTDITLAAAKKLLSENELAKFTTIVPGSRSLKEVHLGD